MEKENQPKVQMTNETASFSFFDVTILHSILAGQHSEWPLNSTKSTLNVYHSDAMWYHLCRKDWGEKEAGHSLTLVIMTSAIKVKKATSRNSNTKNQCDVIPDSSPESCWIVGIETNFDPIWKGNLPPLTTGSSHSITWSSWIIKSTSSNTWSELLSWEVYVINGPTSLLVTHTKSLYSSITVVMVINA